MGNNPIDTNSFRHFLLIRGVETEISEPTNFDQSNFKVVQDDIARDTYFGNEESQLEFYLDYGIPSDPYMNNDGVLISHLSSGFDLINEENKNFGNESDVKYILKKDGIEFTTGNVDFSKDYDSDNETYIKCRIIQNNNQALIKKREDIVVDLLSTKDLDDNTISAIPMQKLFLKAKPIYGESRWSSPTGFVESNFFAGGGGGISNEIYYYYNTPQQVDLSEIDNTLSFLNIVDVSYGGESLEVAGNFGFLQANEDLSNIKLSITDLFFAQTTDVDEGGNGYVGTQFNIVWGFSIDNPIGLIRPIDYNLDEYQNFIFNQDLEFTIPFIPKGAKLWIYFRSAVNQTATTGIPFQEPKFEAFTTLSAYNIKITATSTAISSVVNAVRQIDLIKQTYKAIGSLPVNAQKYDVGGEFYDNFLFNKNLIKQDSTKPFYNKLKDVKEDLLEQCAFAQINDNEIYIGQYEDYYKNIDLGGFLEVPDIEANITKNPKYLVNNFTFGYEKYEQDRNEKNTVDSIHTNSEWFPQANNSTNKKEFKLPYIRDPFITEVARRQIFSSSNTSTSDDDNIFKFDVITLPPNSRAKFTRFLNTSFVGGNVLKILSDGTFSWNLLGFNVGDTIIVNNINQLVTAITPSIITLTAVFNIPNAGTTIAIFCTVDYPLTNVLYTIRTNEGLISSENLRNADNFGNLRYSIKRNIRHWYSVLATYGKFIPTKKVKNTYFKANGECTTQFSGESEPIKENEDILISDITDKKILSQDIYKTRVKCTFEQAVNLLNDIQNVRGFVRVQNPSGAIIKGYIKEADNLWVNEELSLELEVKNESDFLEVTYSGGLLYINEVGYDEKVTSVKNYNIFNDFIQFFDNNCINLSNRIKFDKVLINGVTYNNIDNLINAIESL